MRIQGPFYLTLGKHKKSYWLNGICGREGMKTLRHTKKICLKKLIFILAGISASLRSHLIPATKIKTSCCQNKTASVEREVLCHSWSPACQLHGSSHSTWTSTVLLFPWLGLVQTAAQRSVLYRHRTGSQSLLPGRPLSLKLTASFEIWLSPAVPLCEQGKTAACKKYGGDCLWMSSVNSLSEQIPLKPTLSSSGTNWLIGSLWNSDEVWVPLLYI